MLCRYKTGSDCGLALASLYEGENPAKIIFIHAQHELWEHILQCLENKAITYFPHRRGIILLKMLVSWDMYIQASYIQCLLREQIGEGADCLQMVK